MTDTTKSMMTLATDYVGTGWQTKLENLTAQPWSQLISCLGFAEHILLLLGLNEHLDPSKNPALVKLINENGEPLQAAMMHHVGEIVVYAHEKISAEVDRRFSLVKINTP